MTRWLAFLVLFGCGAERGVETLPSPSIGRYVVDLAASPMESWLVWSDGRVEWNGSDRFGSEFEGIGAQVRAVEVFAGTTQCARTDEAVWCRVYGQHPRRFELGGDGRLTVGVGGLMACIGADGGARCALLHELADEFIIPPGVLSMLSLGRGHACGVVDGRAGCWGSGTRGALDGVRLRDDSETPVFPEGLDPTAPRAVRAGADRSCAVLRDGSLWCFGSYGMRWPNWNDPERTRAQRIPGTYVDVFLGDHHTCAVDEDGRPWCFGLASDGLLGPEVRADQRCEFEVADASPRVEPCTWRPTPIDLVHVVKMALGRFHSCAMDEGHNVFCWGSNERGQIAFPPSPLPHYEPTLIARGLCDVGNGGGP